MKRDFTLIILCVASLFISQATWADGEHTIEMEADPAAWAYSSYGFDMGEIAAELGTDASTLLDAINNWRSINYASDFFMLKLTDGTWSSDHGSAGDGAFYIDQDGGFLSGWGSAAGYCRLDNDDTTLSITIGQTGNLSSGDIKSVCSINYNGQRVVFNTTLHVVIPEIDKKPVTTIADLNIVGSTTFKHTQPVYSSWENEPNTIPTPGITDLLGIDPAYMESHIKPMLFAKHFDSGSESWSPELAHDFTATPSPGFWFNSGVWDEETQAESTELTHGEWLGNTNNKFWVASLAFNPEEDAFECTIGQYPGAWTLGENHQADIYIVYGDKAYVITVDLTVDMEDLDPITNYNRVGEVDFTIQRDPRGGWTETDSLALDMEAVLAAFKASGVELTASDLTLYGTNEYGGITDNYTADPPGFWMTNDNVVTSYSGGEKNIFIDFMNDEENNVWYLKVGNTPDVFTGGETFADTLYLINGQNYYALNIELTMDKPSYTLADCEIIEKTFNVQVVPSSSAWEIGKTSMVDIESLIGTSSGVLYGVNQAGETTTAYSVSEATTYGGGGFWMSPVDENGWAYAAGYSGTGAFAMWYYESNITWFNVPGFSQPGDIVYSTFYIANLWEGKAVKLNLRLKYVSQIAEIVTVGEEDILLAGRNEEGRDYAETTVDLTKAMAALECEDAEAFAVEGMWYALNESGDLVDTENNYDETCGFTLNDEGFAVNPDSEDGVVQVGFFDTVFRAFILSDEDVDKEYETTLYVTFREKTYAFHILVNTEKAVGIKTIDTTAESGATYDISGRLVKNPKKGVYIQDGKKILVK